MTADTLNAQCNRARGGANPSVFTDHPCQAGAFFQWANPDRPRYAYSPIEQPVDWNNTTTTDYWSVLESIHESSPEDYPLTYGGTVNFRRPTDGAIDGPTNKDINISEIVQTLYYSPYSPVDNMIYAFVADGYFDRIQYSDVYAVNATDEDAGYWGQIIYNPISKASIFIPYSGYIAAEGGGGILGYRGEYINMWLASCINDDSALIWNYGVNDNGGILDNARAAGFSVRPVIEN